MIIDGRKIAEEILAELKKEISDKDLRLQLAAVLVGDDPEFKKFVELKGKAAEKAGVEFTIYKFPEEIDTNELLKNIYEINNWADGVLVELPLPKHINQQEILNSIPVKKDVDALSDEAQNLFYNNESKIFPPAVEALRIIFGKEKIVPKGKKVAVFGQGILIGKPISHWLEHEGAEVYKINSKTKNPEELSREADIIITGVGRPGLVNGDMVKEGVIVVDYGYGKKENKMTGDVEYETVAKKSSLITPVPGGAGPILIVAVLMNLLTLNEK